MSKQKPTLDEIADKIVHGDEPFTDEEFAVMDEERQRQAAEAAREGAIRKRVAQHIYQAMQAWEEMPPSNEQTNTVLLLGAMMSKVEGGNDFYQYRLLEPSDGLGQIAYERRRQIEIEGWDASHDDTHTGGELALAAAAYAAPWRRLPGTTLPGAWPWDEEYWKPTDDGTTDGRMKELAKAGGLIAAEIDRLFRESVKAEGKP